MQSLACIVKGPPTAAEKRLYKGGTLWVAVALGGLTPVLFALLR